MISFLKNLFRKKVIIVPRLKDVGFLKVMESVPGFNKENMPIHQPLINDLIITYAIDNGTSYQMVDKSDLKEMKITQSEMIEIAYENGRNEISKMKIGSNGSIFQLMAGNNMSACSLLYPDLWDHLMDELDGPIMAIFPHRDLAYYGKQCDQTLKCLQEIIAKGGVNDNHNLTNSIFLRKEKSKEIPLMFYEAWPHQINCWEILK